MVLYVTLNKAIHGCLILALLLYEKIVADMRCKGFELDSYGPWVANKMIGGKKMIIFWNVDNLKVLNVDSKEVTNFMEWLEGIYGGLSITRGEVHEYIGMTLYLKTPGELWVTMVD